MKSLPHPIRASFLAERLGIPLEGEDRLLQTVAPLEEAESHSLSFAMDGRRITGNPGVLLAKRPVPGVTTLVVPDPLRTLSEWLGEWFPEPLPRWRQTPEGAWIAENAVIHPTARLFPGVVVGDGSEVGEDTVLFPNVVVQHGVRVGRRCRLHAGTVLGADGFRYHPTAKGVLKVPQVGGVWLGDDIEIGANSTVDRGFLSDTRIGDGCKIDNQVQIGHNCRLGKSVILVSQTGLSGSCVIGDWVMIGGQVGFAEGSEVGDGARVGARSAVRGRIPAGETWLGAPAMPIAQARRIYAALPDLPAMWKKFIER